MRDYRKHPDPKTQLREALAGRDTSNNIEASTPLVTHLTHPPQSSASFLWIYVTVPGQPVGKPRMTQRDKWAERPEVVRYRDWCDLARSCLEQPLPSTDQIESLDWTAYFSPPASWSKKKKRDHCGRPHRAKPDRDNIDKAVLDCFFDEDSGIFCGTIAKYWAEEPRLEIRVKVSRVIASTV